MLDLGVCRWDHIVLGSAEPRGRGDAAARAAAHGRRVARRRGHMAKLSVNAMIGLWARSTEVVYSVRSSSSKLDGAGADFSQAFAYKGGMVWDFVYARRLLSNYRPIHDAVLGFEHCMVAKARRILDAPPRYLAQVKTDCLLTQRLPKRFAERLRALEALRHPGRHAGLPRGRDEAVAGQPGAAHGGGAAQTTEVERGGRPYKPLPGGQLPAAHGPAGRWRRSRSWTWRSGPCACCG